MDNLWAVETFLNGLPEEWEIHIKTVAETRNILKENDCIDLDDIYAIAESIYGDKKPGGPVIRASSSGSGDDERKRKVSHGDGREKHGGDYFYCRRHGRKRADHDEQDCSYKKRFSGERTGTRNEFYGSKNEPRAATSQKERRDCDYCGKQPWKHMHM